MNFRLEAKNYNDPEVMAADYLSTYFGNQKIQYPVNPFKMLRDEGIFFALSDFKNLEGVYVRSPVLMPITELRIQVNKRKNTRGNVSFDDVLEISDYFGVSFAACIYRIAYKIHAIEGDTEPDSLRKRIQKYKPDSVRKKKHITYADLYAGLIDKGVA